MTIALLFTGREAAWALLLLFANSLLTLLQRARGQRAPEFRGPLPGWENLLPLLGISELVGSLGSSCLGAPDLSVEEEKGEQDEGPPLFNASHHPHFGDPQMSLEMPWERVALRTRQRTKKSKPTPANLARQGGPWRDMRNFWGSHTQTFISPLQECDFCIPT